MSSFLRWLRGGLLRLAGLFHRNGREQDLSEEMESHLALEIQDYIRSGMAPAEARRRALLKAGGMEQAKELYRERRSVPLLETTLQDLGYSLRTLGKSPGFTIAAVITLALGVAANTTIFSVVSPILLRKPPVADADRVMVISSINKSDPQSFSGVSVPDYIVWREQAHFFEGLVATAYQDVTLSGGSEPQRVAALNVTAGYFRVLEVPAAMGRTFLPGDDAPGHEHVVLLSHKLWQSRFNADRAIVGQAIPVDGERYTVIGVMPATFRLNIFDAAVWMPLIFTPQQLGPSGRAERPLSVLARLKHGVSPEQAQAEMATIASRLEESYAESDKNWSARVLSLQEFMIQSANVRAAMVVLMGAVVFVLLIACTNIANLMIARNSARQRELVIRAAVGAGRLRLVRQLLVESLLIGLAGGGLGFLLAFWGTALLRSNLTWNDYVQLMASEMVLDWRVFVFCALISILAAIFFGLLPAIQASKVGLSAGLAEGSRGGSGGVERRRLRRALVVGEIALSIILLTGAGVMIQAVVGEMQNPLGFEPQHVLTTEIRVAGARYAQPSEQAAFFQKIVEGVHNLPGVDRSAVANALPVTAAAGSIGFRLEGETVVPKDLELKTRHYVAGSNYFQVMGIPLIKGRGLLASDSNNAPLAVVVNETFAQRFFAKQDPIGHRILVDDGQTGKNANWSEIVGVVGYVPDFRGQSKPEPQIYQSFLQRPQTVMTMVVQSKADPATLAPLLRRSIWAVDRDQPVGAIRTMNQVVDDAGMGDRLMGWLMGCFAGLALLLAGVGIFGVIAYNVSQRTREVGIRMALGAGKSAVLRLVVGQSAWLTGLGVGLGLLGAFPLPRALGDAFNGLPVYNAAWILAGVATLVVLVSLVASYVPARRAMRVDPVTALRYE
ncbi:MAG TPA: ABC transporter permease [Bryobacteraceae bacterium]|nr:ABC transporter permease [Bryobacteraceae bacterium]